MILNNNSTLSLTNNNSKGLNSLIKNPFYNIKRLKPESFKVDNNFIIQKDVFNTNNNNLVNNDENSNNYKIFDNILNSNYNIIKKNATQYNPLYLPVVKLNDKNDSAISNIRSLSQNQSNFKSNSNSSKDVLYFNKKYKNTTITQRKIVNENMQNHNNLLYKYDLNINSNRYNQLKLEHELKSIKIKENNHINGLIKQKMLNNKSLGHKLYRKKKYDNYYKPILVKEDFDKGLYNMINRGLIPKNADLTLAFSRKGNPLKFNPEEFEKYDKSPYLEINNVENHKEITIDTEEISSDLSKCKDIKDNITDNNNNVFITNINNSKKDKINIENLINKRDNEKMLKFNCISDTKNNNNYYLDFVDYKIVKNESYNSLRINYPNKWSLLSYMLLILEKIFKNLSIGFAQVDSKKLLLLIEDELNSKSITKFDLIKCLSDFDLKKKGIKNIASLMLSFKDNAAILIQKHIIGYVVREKFRKERIKFKSICKIQTMIRLHKLIRISKSLIENKLKSSMIKYKKIIKDFKNNWKQSYKRNYYKKCENTKKIYEIHINSISYSSNVNCTISKYNERQNNQLTRLISLMDERVHIIYISSFEIPEDVISYYVSILNTIGITNVKERIHFLVPDACTLLPRHYCLSSLLYFSSITCNKIKKIVQNNYAYIIPGIPSKYDSRIALYLEYPILYNNNYLEINSNVNNSTETYNNNTITEIDDNYFSTEYFFSKSGSKRVFELCELAVPIGEWNFEDKEDIIKKLSKLISTYPSINIWIFKIDNEIKTRGIATLHLDKIKQIQELKKERIYTNNSNVNVNIIKPDNNIDKNFNNLLLTKEKFEENIYYILKSILNKKLDILNKNIYNSGEDYFNEFISKGGVIEACPTYSLTGITGSPVISFLIEPDGIISNYCSFDKILSSDLNSGCYVSPQSSINNLVS